MLPRLAALLLLIISTTHASSLWAVAPGEILPTEVDYDPEIPSPQRHFGFAIGQRHLHHHELVEYMRVLADSSDRVTIAEYARSYGDRPLITVQITSPTNHQQLADIRQTHRRLASRAHSGGVDISELPAVVQMGYSVHGNEASAGNASALVAYYLAAVESQQHRDWLDKVVVILDPCLNPDGFERFANWVNNHRGTVANPDPHHREHREPWPSGRTNYYWFDLNRDWLPAQHPESRGRLALYHRWKPNVVLDFHEMGTNSTHFFQPGVPARENPLTPVRARELTKRFADYHATALDKVGALYYTEERYDDFYMGKGSTYPDLHGAIGILFEQASSRGQLQESRYGNLSFPYTIRNQFLTSLSSLQATFALRTELLEHKRTFYRDADALVRAGKLRGYVVTAPGDRARLSAFLDILLQHDIQAFPLSSDLTVDKIRFAAGESYWIPAAQDEFRFLQTLFERRKKFAENIFYDVSTWTLPLAFQLQYAAVDAALEITTGEDPFPSDTERAGRFSTHDRDLAYVIDWRGYFAPRTLYRLLNAKIKVSVAGAPFSLATENGQRRFGHGSLMVPLGIQAESRRPAIEILKQAAAAGVGIVAAQSGLTPRGIDLGSDRFLVVPKPKVLLVTGSGVSAYEAGEVWHLLDRRMSMPLTLADTPQLGRIDLSTYTVVVMVSGSYGAIGERGVERLRRFVEGGGTLVAIGTANRWVDSAGIAVIPQVDREIAPGDATTVGRRPYAEAARDAAFDLIRGAIFLADVDLSHPVGYGISRNTLPVFRNNRVFLKASVNRYSTPVIYSTQPWLSGYISPENLDRLSESASVVVHPKGDGRVISLAENPNFRAFWFGTNRIFLNCLFFGPLIRTP